MTSKSNLVKFTALLILVSLFGAACSQATPEEQEIVISVEEAQEVQGADPTAPATRHTLSSPDRYFHFRTRYNAFPNQHCASF